MQTVALYLPFLLLVVVANLSEQHRRSPDVTVNPQKTSLVARGLQYLPYGLLVATNMGLLGITALALLTQLVKILVPGQAPAQTLAVNWGGVAAACLITSLLAFVPLIRTARVWLARWLPIDPDSVVHATALAFAVYHVGLSLGQMALIGSLDNLTAAGLALTIWDLVLTAVILLLFALTGVGLFIRRDLGSALQRLGLGRINWKQVGAAVGVTILLLAFDFGVNLAWQAVNPTGYDLLQRVTENLFGSLLTVGGGIALGLSAGISEETLFRGAVQPRLGIVLTAGLFAVAHLQYGLTVATLEVFVIGLVLGWMRRRTNTTVCILIHASYNTASVLLGMLQP
jgi:membrane protease YdiL (CAAX protease family)